MCTSADCSSTSQNFRIQCLRIVYCRGVIMIILTLKLNKNHEQQQLNRAVLIFWFVRYVPKKFQTVGNILNVNLTELCNLLLIGRVSIHWLFSYHSHCCHGNDNNYIMVSDEWSETKTPRIHTSYFTVCSNLQWMSYILLSFLIQRWWHN